MMPRPSYYAEKVSCWKPGFRETVALGSSVAKGKTKGRSVIWLAQGIEPWRAPASLLGEGSEL